MKSNFSNPVIAVISLIFIANILFRCNGITLNFGEDDYPMEIPQFYVRRDYWTNEEVSRGRFDTLGGMIAEHGHSSIRKRIPLQDFKKALQCSPYQPDLVGNRGTLGLMKLVKPTKEFLEVLCVWAEVKCNFHSNCKSLVKLVKANPNISHFKELGEYTTSPYQVRLFRISNGSIHLDWPWGLHRFPKSRGDPIILLLLSYISDIKDCVFFMGESVPFLPHNVPFASFVPSPSILNGDLPWIWPKPIQSEYKYYLRAEREKNFTDANYISFYTKDVPWVSRIPKAAWYGTLNPIRQVFIDVAVSRPDLIEAKWVSQSTVIPWNPSSSENPSRLSPTMDFAHTTNITSTNDRANESRPGYLQNLLGNRIPQRYVYNPGSFKYLVVLLGLNGGATADRLIHMLAYSGAVVLLQESQFSYFFSSRLKPWVHYVPISYSTTDVVDKIEWLRDHDELARQIAINARNFGKSYLRFEDYFCYVLAALEAVAKLEEGSDVLEPFSTGKGRKSVFRGWGNSEDD